MGRQAKNEKIKLEKLIMTVYYETNRGKNILTEKQAAVITAVRKTLGFLKMIKHLDNKNPVDHEKIFKHIYFHPITEKDKNGKIKTIKKRKTMAGFAIDMEKHENTLTAYTDNYISCFEKYLNIPNFNMPELE